MEGVLGNVVCQPVLIWQDPPYFQKASRATRFERIITCSEKKWEGIAILEKAACKAKTGLGYSNCP